MSAFGAENVRNEALLVARVLLVVLFLVFGWGKLTDYQGTLGYMAHTGAPLPPIAAVVSIIVELGVSIAIILGVLTRPLALLLALYALATGIIAHHYWTMSGAERLANEINFFKNISIMGGLILLYVAGAGKYSVDARLGIA